MMVTYVFNGPPDFLHHVRSGMDKRRSRISSQSERSKPFTSVVRFLEARVLGVFEMGLYKYIVMQKNGRCNILNECVPYPLGATDA